MRGLSILVAYERAVRADLCSVSPVQRGARYFIGLGVLAILASLVFVGYESTNVWARDGVSTTGESTGVASIFPFPEVHVVYVDEAGTSRTGRIVVAKAQISNQFFEVQYLRSDPAQVRSAKHPWSVVFGALIFATPMILLGLIGHWGTRRFPELSEKPSPT